MLKKLKHRYRKWQVWRTFCNFGKVKQVLIFLHIIHCGWFENFEIREDI